MSRTETFVTLSADVEDCRLDEGDERTLQPASARVSIRHTGRVIFALNEAAFSGVGRGAHVDLSLEDTLAIIHALQAAVDSGKIQ